MEILVFRIVAVQIIGLWITADSQAVDSYQELIDRNEQLTEELSALRTRLQYLSSECTCPNQLRCEYNGRSYEYRAVFRGGDCERCSCEEDGEVRCRFDDTIPGCGDQCLSNPCYNGGTCQGQGSAYVCICPPDCTGSQCETREVHTCSLPIDRGTACSTASPSVIWYYEPLVDDCVQSQYQGCGGNGNRYRSYSECESSCLRGTCCTRSQLRPDTLYGHSPSGYDRYGFREGVNEIGEQATEMTATAFGSLRYRFQGLDFKGYRSDGYNKDRFSRSGYNCQSVDQNQLSEDGLSVGFNYSCLASTKFECMSRIDTEDLTNEVISFNIQESECGESSCHDATQCRGCQYNGNYYKYEEMFNNGCSQCICTRTGSVQCTCAKTAQRKEIRDMTAAEVATYQRAVRKLYVSGSWTDLSLMYDKYLPHSHNHNFLAWHRALLSHIELSLQKVSGSCDIAIPYFDWTIDSGLLLESPIWRAGLFGGNGDVDTQCVQYHPFSEYSWSPCLRRQFNTSVSLPDPVMMERILRTEDFTALNDLMSSASLLFRSWVGGHAASRNAIYDPVVLSHFAFVDKIWHEWQMREDNYINLQPETRYRPLAPFGLSTDDINSSPLQLCVVYIPLNSLCKSDLTTPGRTYTLSHPRAFDAQGYDSSGFDRFGYNREGYNGDNVDKDGYNRKGYDRYGFDRYGMSKLGISNTGEITSRFNPDVLDKQNYTRLGVDIRGRDFEGRDIFGYNSRGFDRPPTMPSINTYSWNSIILPNQPVVQKKLCERSAEKQKREVLSPSTVDLSSLIRGSPGLPGVAGPPMCERSAEKHKREVLSPSTVDLSSLIRGSPGLPGVAGPPGRDGTPGKDGRDFASMTLLHSAVNDKVQKEWKLLSSQLPIYSGATYTRWGRTSCGADSKMIYKGAMTAPSFLSAGGGSNYLCLPEDPQYPAKPPKALYSAMKHTFYTAMHGKSDLFKHGVPCIVCETNKRVTQLMLPAATKCPSSDWTLDYSGLIMSPMEHQNGAFVTSKEFRMQYVCVDADGEAVSTRGPESGWQGSYLYPVGVTCSGGGAIGNCPPYKSDDSALSCVVCSK